MDQLGDDEQVSMTTENQEMLLSFDSEAESPSPTLDNSFRLETNSKFIFINSTSRLSYDTRSLHEIMSSKFNNNFSRIKNVLIRLYMQVVQKKWDNQT